MIQALQIMKSPVGSLVVLTTLAILPSIATAADSADRHLDRGVLLLSHDRDKEALEEFRAAYALSPSPVAAAQMGLAESSLKLWVDAEKHLSEAIEATTNIWVKHNSRTLVAQLEIVRTHLGWLVVTGTPNAQVTIDGAVVGRLPLPLPTIRHAEGPVMVRARLDGHVPILRNIEVVGGGYEEVKLELKALPSPATLKSPALAFEPTATRVTPVAPTSELANAKFYRALPWVSMVAGASAVANGLLLYQARSSCKSSCNPSKGLMAGALSLGGLGVLAGGEMLILTATHQAGHEAAKAVLIVSTALAAVGILASGSVLAYREGYGSNLRAGAGATSLAIAGMALALDAFALSEPSPGQRRVSVAPLPGGLAFVGRF